MLKKHFFANIKSYSVIPEKFLEPSPAIFDFIKGNNISGRLGIGRYGEDRKIYQSPLYTSNGEARSVHLGLDLFVPAGTPIFAPLDAIIHSFQDNNHFLDYGPTIILEHNTRGKKFCTLYGHLGRSSLEKIKVGQKIEAGEEIAIVGKTHENGHWPPHLHFQIITDLLGWNGDFPGVARPSEKEYYLKLCPDPDLLLKIL